MSALIHEKRALPAQEPEEPRNPTQREGIDKVLQSAIAEARQGLLDPETGALLRTSKALRLNSLDLTPRPEDLDNIFQNSSPFSSEATQRHLTKERPPVKQHSLTPELGDGIRFAEKALGLVARHTTDANIPSRALSRFIPNGLEVFVGKRGAGVRYTASFGTKGPFSTIFSNLKSQYGSLFKSLRGKTSETALVPGEPK